MLETHDLADHPGHREAAFAQLDLFLARLDLRIDDDHRLVLVVVHVHHEEALGDVDLRRGQTDARRGVHRFEHVVDQLLKERLADLFGLDSLRDFAQRRVAFG